MGTGHEKFGRIRLLQPHEVARIEEEKLEKKAIAERKREERAAKRERIPDPDWVKHNSGFRRRRNGNKGRNVSSCNKGMVFLSLLVVLLLFLGVTGVSLYYYHKTPISPSPQTNSSSVSTLGDSSVNYGSNDLLSKSSIDHRPSSHTCAWLETRLLPDFIGEKLGKIPALHSINTNNLGFQSLNHQVRQVFDEMPLRADNASEFCISVSKDSYTHLFPHDMSQNLYNAKARKIICMGIEPLVCSPRALWESYNSTATPTNQTSAVNLTHCAEDINQLVLQYNAMISVGLLELNNQLFDAKIIFCDVYQGMAESMQNPELCGFSNVRDACCWLGRYGGMVGCVSEDLACRDSSQHFWWDFYNPTQGVNALLANWSWNGQPHRLCRPFNIQQLASSSSAEHLNVTHP